MGPPSRASSASSMHPPPGPPPRFPLMTPSASPPIHRPFSRQSSTSAPAKKRRVSRAPSIPSTNTRSFSVASASSSSVSPAFNFDASVDPAEELDAARRASSFRVLNVWSQLAEKYTRRLDEDDIVDLGNGTIIKDCGVLRSTGDMFEIGYFAEEQEKAERLEHDQPLTPADDEPDELDAFADIQDNVSRSETDGDEGDGLELAQHTKRLPPVRELDPADAADLAEFLRAEQTRRETFGDPGEENEENEFEEEEGETEYSEEVDAQEEYDEDDGTTECEARSSGDEEETVYQESVPESEGDKSSRQDYLRLSTPSGSPEFDILELSHVEKDSEPATGADSGAEEQLDAVSNVDSDDELGGWDRDEGSTLYSVAELCEESGDEGDRVSLKETSAIVSTNQSSKPRRKRNRANVENAEHANEQETVRHQSKCSPKKTSAHHSPSPPVKQLQTPPRSTSFGPEERNFRVTATYSRKRRGLSSSPRKTPLRIQSTASESSASESEDVHSPSKSQKQRQSSPLPGSPTKKMRLVPEVVIDVSSPSTVKKAPKDEQAHDSRDLSPPSIVDTARELRTQAKGKARAVDVDQSGSFNRKEEMELFSPPPKKSSPRSRSQSTKDTPRDGSPKGTSLPKSKRRRGPSPDPDDSYKIDRTVDVIMNSPTSTPVRSSSRRTSYSRRSAIREVESYDEPEPGPSSPKAQPSSSHRSRSRPSAEQSHEVQPRSHPLPELNTFSFTPPHAPHYGYQSYPPPHFTQPPGLSQQQHSAQLPNFQDPSAQYHLAQALQSLSILMGGALPFPSSPAHAPHASQQPHHFVPHGQPWPPYTPRHHNHIMNFDTPHSVASEPPPSSPLGSDCSDSIPSSPTKRPLRERGRSHAQSFSSMRGRPKSAIREARTPSRSRSRSSLRVSFSSPEATQIEDDAYEYVSDEVIEVKDSDEDSDFERRRLRREELSKRSSELHVRAQTPGPPDRAAKPEYVEGSSRHSTRRELEPKRKQSKAAHSGKATRHQNGRGHR